MRFFCKLERIRVAEKSNARQMLYSILIAIIIGIIMGISAKLVDHPEMNPFLDDLGGRLGIWIFTAALLSVYSRSSKLAAIRVFLFFVSMLTVYYLYTVYLLHFFPRSAIVFWGLCAAISPACAFVMWYARGNCLISDAILSLPVALLMTEGFDLRNAYLPVHTHYYLIPWEQGVYVLMIAALLLLVPNNKKRCPFTLALSIVLSFFLIYFDVLGRIFGGMNGVL